MRQIEIRQYEGIDVSFLVAGRNMKVNATEMAKVYGREVKKFMKTDTTKAFIEALIRSPKGYRLGIESESDIYENRGRNGMWMHRVLALKFAAWLDAEFEVWVYITIDELLFGTLPELAAQKTELEKQIEEQELKMMESEEYTFLQELKLRQKAVNKSIASGQRNQMNLFSDN